MDLQSQVAIGDFPVWLDLSLFPCLLLGSAASGQESEEMCQWLVLRGEGGWGGPVLAGGSSGGAQMPSVSRTVWRVRPGPLRGEGGGRSAKQSGRDSGRAGGGYVGGMGYVWIG